MLCKLIRCNVTGKLCNAKSIYSSSYCSIAINKCFTDKFATNACVRQGGPLSSTLFNICINELVSFVNDGETVGVKFGANY